MFAISYHYSMGNNRALAKIDLQLHFHYSRTQYCNVAPFSISDPLAVAPCKNRIRGTLSFDLLGLRMGKRNKYFNEEMLQEFTFTSFGISNSTISINHKNSSLSSFKYFNNIYSDDISTLQLFYTTTTTVCYNYITSSHHLLLYS